MKSKVLKKIGGLFLTGTVVLGVAVFGLGASGNKKNTPPIVDASAEDSFNYNSYEEIKAIDASFDKNDIPENHEIRFSYLDVLEGYYKQVMDYANDNNIGCDLTFEEFHYLYYKDRIGIDNFVTECIDYLSATLETETPYDGAAMTVRLSSSSSSGGDEWYRDIGTGDITKKPTYTNSAFNLLSSSVYNGDILYEGAGSFGVTGHIAIIESRQYSSTYNCEYIRIIEAYSPAGVCYSLLDDTRFVDRHGYMLWVPSSSSSERANAVDFCVGQVGKDYHCDLQRDTSAYEEDWYCSELVWAAYKNQGIDIEYKGFLGEPGVAPRDIKRCDLVSEYIHHDD